MRLYAFKCGGETLDRAVFDPFDPEVGSKLYVPYFLYLVDHPQGRVLFDTGPHPDLTEDPRKRLGSAADGWDHDLRPGDDVVSLLATIGMEPRDISHVALSHLHYDHSGGLEYFTHCEIYVQAPELPFAQAPPVYQQLAYLAADYDHPLAWHELHGRHDVFGDGALTLVPTPGHTPGHQSMLVRLDGQAILLVGDAALWPRSLETRAVPAAMGAWSPDATVASWGVLEELQAEHDASLLFTHNPNFREDVRLAPDGWYE